MVDELNDFCRGFKDIDAFLFKYMQISWDIVIGHPNIRTTFYWQEYIEMTFLWVRYDWALQNVVNDKSFLCGV